MSTTDDLRGLLDALGDLGAVSPDVDLLADIVEGVINALIERESATEPIKVDIVPDTSAFQIAMLTAERDRLRADYERTAEAADRAAVRLREARQVAESAQQTAADYAEEVAAAERDRDAARAERDDLAALVARQREDGQRKDAALVRAKAKRRKAEARAAHWKVNAGLYDAAALLNIERANDAEAAIARVRALLDGRAMVPVGLLAEALEGELQPRKSSEGPGRGLAGSVTAPEDDCAHGEVGGSSGATGGVECVSGPDDAALSGLRAWEDYRREYLQGVGIDSTHEQHVAFLAGWRAARGTLDLGGVQR